VFAAGAGGVAVECGTDVFSHMKATYRGSTTSLTAQASHGDTKTRRKVLGRNADVLVGNSTPEKDKYGNSETRLKNASIRGTDPLLTQLFLHPYYPCLSWSSVVKKMLSELKIQCKLSSIFYTKNVLHFIKCQSLVPSPFQVLSPLHL